MARGMIGNAAGVAARDVVNESLLASITAEGVNTFTVSAADLRNLRVGMNIDISTKVTGALVANRNITNIASTGVVTYDGADAATTTAEGIYLPGQWELASPVAGSAGKVNDPYANFNGGPSVNTGFDQVSYGSIDAMRARLTAINATTYSAAELDKMTYNDMVYAIRVNDALGSI